MSDLPQYAAFCKEAQKRLRRGEYAPAAQLFQQALQLDDRGVDAHEGLATACLLVRDYDRAVKHFERVTQLQPALVRNYVNLGAAHNRAGNYQKAAEALLKGIQRDKSCADAYYNLGYAYRRLNELSMAVSAYREAIRLNPQMAEAHQNLGNVLMESGNHRHAIASFQRALEIKPDFERARNGMREAEKALEKVSAKSSVMLNPFGRLVDVENYAKQAESSAAPPYELSPRRRRHDRANVEALISAIDSAARELIRHTRDELAAAIGSLQKATADGAEWSLAYRSAVASYRETVRTNQRLRKQLKLMLSRFLAHEEQMENPHLARPGVDGIARNS